MIHFENWTVQYREVNHTSLNMLQIENSLVHQNKKKYHETFKAKIFLSRWVQ